MTNGNNTTTPAAPARTFWDAVIAALILAALVLLVFKLVDHKGYKSTDVTGILGVIVPIFGAAAGLVLGAAAGNATGKANGEEIGKQKVLAEVRPLVANLHAQAPGHAESVAGSDIRPAIDQLRGAVGLQG